MAFPRPGPVTKAVMGGLFAIWLIFALGINWGGASGASFLWFTANTDAVLSGQLWRLFTASLLHVPQGTISHIVSAILGVYFLGSSLESSWGPKRYTRFLLLTGVLAYGTQVVLTWLLGSRLAASFAPEQAYGAMPIVEAIAIAWACSFRDRTIYLMMVLPVSSRGLIWFVVGISLMTLIAGSMNPSGYIALFSGMGYGYLLGGGSPSPLRRFYLKYRLARIDAETRKEARARTQKRSGAGLRVIEGGRRNKKDDSMLH